MLDYNSKIKTQKSIFNYSKDYFYLKSENDVYINNNKELSFFFFSKFFRYINFKSIK